MRVHSNSACRLNSARIAGAGCLPGIMFRNRAIEDWIRWMLVDSRGSMNPAASPSARQLCDHCCARIPVVKRRRLGVA